MRLVGLAVVGLLCGLGALALARLACEFGRRGTASI